MPGASLPRPRIVRPLLAFAALAALLSSEAHAAGTNARLGNDVRPTFEAVSLETNPDRPDYRGTVKAEFDVTARVEKFRMHAREMTVQKATITGPGGTTPAKIEVLPPDQIALTPAAPLAPGHYTLTLEFTNNYSRRAAALYRVQTGGHSYLFTQFEATEAREAFPCWDEPSFKFPWQVTLTVPDAYLAVSNTTIEKEEKRGANRVVTFRKTRPLPSYLIAIAVGPFDQVPIRGMSVPGNVVCVKGSSALAAEAASVAGPLLTGLEKYFGRPYPYDKLDLIAAPEFLYGAMENAGAIVFADRRLLLDPHGASATDRRALRGVVAHEMAHMWFGDLVTMSWWDDLWLNESFASWMASKTMDRVFPEYRSGQNSLEGAFRAMETDARPSTGAMRRPIESEDNLSANANELTYNKGQAVLTMFEGWVGVEKFRAGVAEYLKAHEWKNAVGTDLWTAISHASGDDINAPMSSFLDQAGVPLVSLQPLGDGKVRLRQRRFFSSGATGTSSTLWRIPVVMSYPSGGAMHQQRVWLTDSATTVALDGGAKPDWILPNAGSSGYYQWLVPADMLTRIAADRSKLTPEERIGFVRNLTPLLRAGLVAPESFLPLLAAFRDDTEPEVTAAVITGLEAIREPLVSPDLEDAYAQQVRSQLHPCLERIGTDAKAGEIPAITLMRPRLLRALGDMGRDTEVRAWANATTDKILAGATIDPSLAEAALPLAAQSGNAALLAKLTSRFESAAIPTDRAQYLTAMSSVRDPSLVDQELKYVLTGPLRPQEVITLPEGLAAWPPSRDRIYRWMTSNYDSVVTRIPRHMVTRMVPVIRGCSDERVQSAKDFFAVPAHSFPGSNFALSRISDATDDCVRLSQRDGARFGAYLKSMAGRP
jgi:alanyl aminopeptidase